MSEQTYCPYCAESILKAAKKCKHCGEFLDPSLRTEHHVATQKSNYSPGLAAVLSLLIPGAGQMYGGYVGTGIFLLVLTFFGYMLFILPGLGLHIYAVFTAYSTPPKIKP